MKSITVLRLAVMAIIVWPFSPPSFAQALTTGTIIPVASGASEVMPSKKHHKKHSKHTHKEGSSHTALPADERYADLAEATAHCPSGTVEWASLGESPFYHDKQSRWFGHTKHGAYACKAALDKAGFRLGK